jgi:AmmeMemoRadiSam system protein B
MADDPLHHPKLRPLDIRRVDQGGQQLLSLNDPLRLTDQAMLITHRQASVLALCDGTRDLQALITDLGARYGLHVLLSEMEALLQELDENLLLEGPRFQEACQRALVSYRQAPYRRPTLAGAVYPADPADLRRTLDQFCAQAPPYDMSTVSASRPGEIVGILTPHIDYARGHQVYAGVWQQTTPSLSDYDLIVVLGTDHSGGPGKITLTRQHYATPWGTLPTDMEVVEALIRGQGAGAALEEELHHAREHSIELALVWLHYAMQRGAGLPIPENKLPPVVPILCGHMEAFIRNEASPETHRSFGMMLETLRFTMERRRTLVIASGDLAHVGPAFGDTTPLGVQDRARLKAEDATSLDAIRHGDAPAFFQGLQSEGDQRRVCGLTPIYLAMQLLGSNVSGTVTDYAQCPADIDGGSLVSIAGAVWRRN